METVENADQSNPFLFEMFAYGYDAWAAEKRAQDEMLVKELGIDPKALETMSFDELDSWLRAQEADPAKARSMEAILRKHPRLREESESNLHAMEENAGKLLEREDSHVLHLSREEVWPWLERLNERTAEQGFLPETASEESVFKMFQETTLPVLREMAVSIFTPDRLRQLVADLKTYQRELFTSGDKATAGDVLGAITYVGREDTPGLNTFLISLCWASIAAALKTIPEESNRGTD